MLRKLGFAWKYWRRQTPWDTNEVPPELVEFVESGGSPPGMAIDLGCGTGTNVIYLARHGWQAVGIDFIASAIERARQKASEAGVDAQFFVGDVTRLDDVPFSGPFDFGLDIGCFHGLGPDERARYLEQLRQIMKPGAILLLYAAEPHRIGRHNFGIDVDEVRALFEPNWKLEQVQTGQHRPGVRSSWYRLRLLT